VLATAFISNVAVLITPDEQALDHAVIRYIHHVNTLLLTTLITY